MRFVTGRQSKQSTVSMGSQTNPISIGKILHEMLSYCVIVCQHDSDVRCYGYPCLLYACNGTVHCIISCKNGSQLDRALSSFLLDTLDRRALLDHVVTNYS